MISYVNLTYLNIELPLSNYLEALFKDQRRSFRLFSFHTWWDRGSSTRRLIRQILMIHNQVWIRFFCCTFYRITPLLIKWSTRFFLIRTRVLEELRHVEFSNQLTRYSSDAIQWSIDTICVVLFVRKIARGSCTEPTLQDEPYKAEEDARSPFFWTLCLYLLLCSALKTPVGAMTSAILVEHDRLRLLFY